MGYQTPVLRSLTDKESDSDLYALDVLSSILSSGDSGRLSKFLVRGAQIAASASAGYSLYSRLQDMFMLDGTPVQGRTVDDLELALRQQIQRLQNEPVSAEELARIKAQVVASDIYAKDSIMGQASQIGSLETVGLNWHLMDTYVDHINAVTAEQVQKVAQKYLVDDHLTIATLDPQPIDPKKLPVDSGNALGGANVR